MRLEGEELGQDLCLVSGMGQKGKEKLREGAGRNRQPAVSFNTSLFG